MQLWDIECAYPYSVKGRFQRDKNGHEVWIVCLKKAWQHIKGEWHEVTTHPEVLDDPVYSGEPGLSSLIQDHDFSIEKTNTDIILHGKARTLLKRSATQHYCRLLVEGHVDKSLVIKGDRQWVNQAGSVLPSVPAPFIEKEIDLSHAMGGNDERNRLGCGVDDKVSQLMQQNIPSVFYPNEDWSAHALKTRVAGFGPLPVFSQLRSRYAGTFDQRWFDERRPLFPKDFDKQFYQSAPLDQQCDGFLLGGERFVVSGFSHEDALSFFLPKDQFRAEASFSDEEHKTSKTMNLQTVFIDTEEEMIAACWSAAFPCQGREHLLASTKIVKSLEV